MSKPVPQIETERIISVAQTYIKDGALMTAADRLEKAASVLRETHKAREKDLLNAN